MCAASSPASSFHCFTSWRSTAATLITCRLKPSSSSRGKKKIAWCLVMKRKIPFFVNDCSEVKASTEMSTSGSSSTWLGLAWCRLCLPTHQS